MKDKKLIFIAIAAVAAMIFLLALLPKLLGDDKGSVTNTTTSKFASIEEYDAQMEQNVLLRPTRNEDWIYNIYEDHIELVEYIGQNRNVVVPSELPSGTDSTLPVYSIAANCFEEASIDNVIIQPGIIDIAASAFKGSTIQNVAIASTVLRISDSAFNDCKLLKSVKLNEKLTHIGANAFGGCISLSTINTPDSILEYGDSCFSGCTSLVYLEVAGVSEIPESFCSNCTSLAVVKIREQAPPSNLSKEEAEVWTASRSIGNNAFAGCTSLSSIFIPKDITFVSDFLNIDDDNADAIRERLTIASYISSASAVYAATNKIKFLPVDLDEFEKNGNILIRLKTKISSLEETYSKIDSKGNKYIPYMHSEAFFNEIIAFSDELQSKELITSYSVTNDEYTATLNNGQTYTQSLFVSTVVSDEDEHIEENNKSTNADNGEDKKNEQ